MSTTDPVCGMEVDTGAKVESEEYAGHRYYFCSAECRETFRRSPANYAEAPAPAPSREPHSAQHAAVRGNCH